MQIPTLRPAQHEERHDDRQHRRHGEARHPQVQRRRVIRVKHEIGGIRDWQDETRRVGDERAHEQQRQRLHIRLLRGGEHGGRQHDGSGIVRQKRRHHDADQVHQQKEPARRALRVVHGKHCDPVEQSLTATQLRQQHHADEEQIDVGAFCDRLQREADRKQPERDEQHRACHCPDRFWPSEGTQDNASGSGKRDTPGEESGIHVASGLWLARSLRMPQAFFREVPNSSHSASEPIDTAPSTRKDAA
ncbi:hypothetical protein SAMN05216466_10818 [Paraburkholderia phenazinium]|uniref:Uncharacterized protein n=1 Tax=Paraburkholderia phenazinium TaxID=60549 RepID=A0A1G8AN14_9BURK|nr:hypothetical protein SAMN05216466_10818 [Paraburkholderia phenazinium]